VPKLLKDTAECGEERVAVGVTSGVIWHISSLVAFRAAKAVTDGVIYVQSAGPLQGRRLAASIDGDPDCDVRPNLIWDLAE
jgi:hypothetical protein